MTFYEKKGKYRFYNFIIFIVMLMLMFFVSTVGTANISFLDAIKIVLSKVPFLGKYISLENVLNKHITIVWTLRAPRIIAASLIGMALSGSGVVFQGIFKNPMADPYVLGVSSGAAFGATVALLFGFGSFYLGTGAVTIMAFIGAIFATWLVYTISKVGGKTPVVTLLLSGIAVSFFLSSLISLMMTFNREQVEQIVFWTMGSVSKVSWEEILICGPIIITGSVIFIIFSKDLNIMLMGDETAKGLGIEVEKLRVSLLFLASIVAASAVSIAGIIGFTGLVVPHAIRMVVGPDHRRLIPMSIICGGIFMVLADTIARTVVQPAEIPLGVITSLVGAPYFIYLLVKNKKSFSR